MVHLAREARRESRLVRRRLCSPQCLFIALGRLIAPGVTDVCSGPTLESLEKRGLIVTAKHNRAAFDRTKWYAIDYDALAALTTSEETSDRIAQIEQFDASQNEQVAPQGTVDERVS